jgi:HD superfamily phosphodiesterase
MKSQQEQPEMLKQMADSMDQKILDLLKAESPFFNSDIHGLQHWQTVERNGHYLARFTGADIKVISYFAHFHDCMRENEGRDPKHGLRGALFAEKHRSLVGPDRYSIQANDRCL